MKLRVTFKTPDVTDAVEQYIVKHCEVHDEYNRNCTPCIDRKLSVSDEIQALKEQLRKFIMFDELVVLEFDTEAGTATVLPARKR